MRCGKTNPRLWRAYRIMRVLQTNKAFHITNTDNVNRQVNSSQDFHTYLNQLGVSWQLLFSSVLVQKQNKEKVSLSISKPLKTSAQVTESQYANAAITAGATDVAIDVASVKKSQVNQPLSVSQSSFCERRIWWQHTNPSRQSRTKYR